MAFWLLLGLLYWAGPVSSAQFVVVNMDDEGEGLNDPTPVDPEGGNTGITLGEQRLIALQFAADLLGERLQSVVEIQLEAQFNNLACDDESSVLGAARPKFIAFFESGQPLPPRALADTWYPVALMNALAGQDVVPEEGGEIEAVFNSRLEGNADCLMSPRWYYGLDGNPPAGTVEFIGTAVHELIHGLGFITFTNLETGEWLSSPPDTPIEGLPDIYARFVRDLTDSRDWDEMSAQERRLSATNDGQVVWNGLTSNANGAPILDAGINQGHILLFAPATVDPAASISHWDISVLPNDLMEPFETGDVSVVAGIGLATCLLQDIGWTLAGNARCPDINSTAPPADGGDDEGSDQSCGGSGSAVICGNGGGGGGCAPTGPRERLDIFLPLMLVCSAVACIGTARRRKCG